MDLVLTRDIHGNHFPINPRFVTLQTSAGTGGNTVLVHAHAATNALVAPPLVPGAAGGFPLVVARRDLLDQAPTNPAVILTNLTFQPGALGASDATAAMQGLQSALKATGRRLPRGRVLVSLTSMGILIPAAPSRRLPGRARRGRRSFGPVWGGGRPRAVGVRRLLFPGPESRGLPPINPGVRGGPFVDAIWHQRHRPEMSCCRGTERVV